MQLKGILITAFSEMAKSNIKEAILIVLFLPPSSNSQVAATNNILLAIKSKAPKRNKYNIKDSQ